MRIYAAGNTSRDSLPTHFRFGPVRATLQPHGFGLSPVGTRLWTHRCFGSLVNFLILDSSCICGSGEVFFAAFSWCRFSLVSVIARPDCLGMRELQRARETPLPFRALALFLASAARRFWFGIDVRACGHRETIEGH